MAINIKNDETERLTRELTEATGEGVTTAVTVAVRERLERVRKAELTPEQRAAKAVGLGRQIAAALGPNPVKIEDLYDDATGLPV
jgi:antitoxin VapB